MTVNGRPVTWKWVATLALAIAGFFIAGWIGRVNGYGDDIVQLKEASVEQAVTIKHMAKQVDEIHDSIFEK